MRAPESRLERIEQIERKLAQYPPRLLGIVTCAARCG